MSGYSWVLFMQLKTPCVDAASHFHATQQIWGHVLACSFLQVVFLERYSASWSLVPMWESHFSYKQVAMSVFSNILYMVAAVLLVILFFVWIKHNLKFFILPGFSFNFRHKCCGKFCTVSYIAWFCKCLYFCHSIYNWYGNPSRCNKSLKLLFITGKVLQYVY